MHGSTYAAVFVDFENIYYYFRNNYIQLGDTNDYVLDVLRNLRAKAEKDRDEQCIVMHAYGDFERLEGTPQGSMYLMGIESHNVLGTEHKNAADMRLCIDAMDLLYTRPEIRTFIFVAGDRDYIPVMQHLRQKAKQILAVAFQGNVSGDLLEVIGEDNFIDAESLISTELKAKLREAPRLPIDTPKPIRPVERPAPIAPPSPALHFSSARAVTDEVDREALQVLLENFSKHPEVYLTPYLWKLRNEMAHLADYQRKAVITNLELTGAIRVERRKGEPNDYSVIVINWDHPTVRELYPGLS